MERARPSGKTGKRGTPWGRLLSYCLSVEKGESMVFFSHIFLQLFPFQALYIYCYREEGETVTSFETKRESDAVFFVVCSPFSFLSVRLRSLTQSLHSQTSFLSLSPNLTKHFTASQSRNPLTAELYPVQKRQSSNRSSKAVKVSRRVFLSLILTGGISLLLPSLIGVRAVAEERKLDRLSQDNLFVCSFERKSIYRSLLAVALFFYQLSSFSN